MRDEPEALLSPNGRRAALPSVTKILRMLAVLLCTAAAAAAAQTTPTSAAATSTTGAQAGPSATATGRTPCPSVSSALRARSVQAADLLTFLAGYSTARYAGTTRASVAEADPFFGQTSTQVQQWLTDWCEAYPQRQLADGAQRFFDELPGAGPASAARSATAALGLQTNSITTCSAAAVGACSGCSVTCSAGRQAQCAPGRDLRHAQGGPGRCGAPSQCDCR